MDPFNASYFLGTFDISAGRDQKVNTNTTVAKGKYRILPTLKHRPTEGYKTRAMLNAELAEEKRKVEKEEAAIKAAAADELRRYLESEDYINPVVLPQDTQMELKLTVSEPIGTPKKLKHKKGKASKKKEKHSSKTELNVNIDELPKTKKSGNILVLPKNLSYAEIGVVKDKVSRASFPTDIKLTRKVASPKKKDSHL